MFRIETYGRASNTKKGARNLAKLPSLFRRSLGQLAVPTCSWVKTCVSDVNLAHCVSPDLIVAMARPDDNMSQLVQHDVKVGCVLGDDQAFITAPGVDATSVSAALNGEKRAWYTALDLRHENVVVCADLAEQFAAELHFVSLYSATA